VTRAAIRLTTTTVVVIVEKTQHYDKSRFLSTSFGEGIDESEEI
jgi:hypothetical protein